MINLETISANSGVNPAMVISLIILGIHICFRQGMIFGWFSINTANMLDWLVGKKASKYIQKPIWSCLACMGGIWTILLTWSFDPLLILLVIGLNAVIDKLIFGDEL